MIGFTAPRIYLKRLQEERRKKKQAQREKIVHEHRMQKKFLSPRFRATTQCLTRTRASPKAKLTKSCGSSGSSSACAPTLSLTSSMATATSTCGNTQEYSRPVLVNTTHDRDSSSSLVRPSPSNICSAQHHHQTPKAFTPFAPSTPRASSFQSVNSHAARASSSSSVKPETPNGDTKCGQAQVQVARNASLNAAGGGGASPATKLRLRSQSFVIRHDAVQHSSGSPSKSHISGNLSARRHVDALRPVSSAPAAPTSTVSCSRSTNTDKHHKPISIHARSSPSLSGSSSTSRFRSLAAAPRVRLKDFTPANDHAGEKLREYCCQNNSARKELLAKHANALVETRKRGVARVESVALPAIGTSLNRLHTIDNSDLFSSSSCDAQTGISIGVGIGGEKKSLRGSASSRVRAYWKSKKGERRAKRRARLKKSLALEKKARLSESETKMPAESFSSSWSSLEKLQQRTSTSDTEGCDSDSSLHSITSALSSLSLAQSSIDGSPSVPSLRKRWSQESLVSASDEDDGEGDGESDFEFTDRRRCRERARTHSMSSSLHMSSCQGGDMPLLDRELFTVADEAEEKKDMSPLLERAASVSCYVALCI